MQNNHYPTRIKNIILFFAYINKISTQFYNIKKKNYQNANASPSKIIIKIIKIKSSLYYTS